MALVAFGVVVYFVTISYREQGEESNEATKTVSQTNSGYVARLAVQCFERQAIWNYVELLTLFGYCTEDWFSLEFR